MSGRVLVADDEADIRRLMAFTLRRRGIDVIEAGDGEEALRLARAEHPDLAVLDVMMPGMTGIEVARALAADPETAPIPVVLASAKAQVDEIEAGLASGACAYIIKPFSPPQLADRVQRLIAAAPGAGTDGLGS